jgi:hypothetical protein
VPLLLNGERADPDRPLLDALDGEDRADPRVIGVVIADLIFASGREHEQRRSIIRAAERSAKDRQRHPDRRGCR